MFLTQHIQLNQAELNRLFDLYKNNSEHYLRQRAQILMLRNNGFSVPDISKALFLNNSYVSLYIKAWVHFGFDGFFSDDVDDLYSRINELETPAPVERKPLINWSRVFEVFKKAVVSVLGFSISATNSFFKLIFGFIIWILTKIKAINIGQFYVSFGAKVNNKIKINKHSNNNVVFQIVNILNDGSETKSEELTTKSFAETVNKFKGFFTNNTSFLSENQTIALFLAINDKIQKIRDHERRKRLIAILATIATIYIYFHTTIKGGVVVLTILGMSLTLFNAQNQRIQDNKHFSNTDLSKDSIQIPINVIRDSIKAKQKMDSLLKIDSIAMADSIAMMGLIENREDCFYLAKINNYARKLINEDNTNHYAKRYFISIPDEKYYLCVQSHKDIREAAFQRSFLISNGFENSRIIEIVKNNVPEYALSIGDFTSIELDNMLGMKMDWDEMCYGASIKAFIFHNGECNQ